MKLVDHRRSGNQEAKRGSVVLVSLKGRLREGKLTGGGPDGHLRVRLKWGRRPRIVALKDMAILGARTPFIEKLLHAVRHDQHAYAKT